MTKSATEKLRTSLIGEYAAGIRLFYDYYSWTRMIQKTSKTPTKTDYITFISITTYKNAKSQDLSIV